MVYPLLYIIYLYYYIVVSLPLVISKKDNSPIQKDLRRNRERELYLTIYIFYVRNYFPLRSCQRLYSEAEA